MEVAQAHESPGCAVAVATVLALLGWAVVTALESLGWVAAAAGSPHTLLTLLISWNI